MPTAKIASSRWMDIAWLLVLGVASSVWLIGAAQKIGPTYDEPIYLEEGLRHWRSGSYFGLMDMGTMPLPVDVQTGPLYLFEQFRGRPLDVEAEMATILPWARACTLLFWWMLLIYSCLLGRRLGGVWGGRLAVALIAVEPNLLAHASLATTDLAITACLMMLAYHFAQGRKAAWPRRVALPAALFGMAVLAKASGLVFGPIVMLAFELERLISQGELSSWSKMSAAQRVRLLWRRLTPWRRDLRQIVPLGLLVVFLYCGSDFKAEPSFVQWADSLEAGSAKTAMVWTSQHLCVFSNAGEGIAKQIKHNMRGHGAYLLGSTWPRSFWFYFPLALSIKLALPILLATPLVAMVRRRALVNPALLSAGALLLFSLTCRVQIGVRLMLPLVALLVVGVAVALVVAHRHLSSARLRAVWVGGVALGLAWMTAASISVWPHGLCYTNELWGGVDSGYLRLSDSNYDWGQGVGELSQWAEQRDVSLMYVWYFGTDPAIRQQPFCQFKPIADALPDDVAIERRMRGHLFAASATMMYGPYQDDAARRFTAYLRRQQPVGRTTTFFIYDFREGLAQRPAPGIQRENDSHSPSIKR